MFRVTDSPKPDHSQDNYVPRAVKTLESTDPDELIDRAHAMLQNCVACPRECSVDRLGGETGLCNIEYELPVSNHFPHFGEEDVLRGTNGSGTIFFSMCNLRCVFCQNYEISQLEKGKTCTPEEVAELGIELQKRDCHNINFVTPEHVVPQLVEAICHLVEMGLEVPIVYNTSAYDAEWSLEILDGLVDIYMPDFKFFGPEASRKFMRGPDYPGVAKYSIKEMHRQVGTLRTNDRGLAEKGLIIRHLIMPGETKDSKRILDWIAENLPRDTYVNIMDQYYPAAEVEDKPDQWSSINRKITREEYEEVREHARELDLINLDPQSSRFAI